MFTCVSHPLVVDTETLASSTNTGSDVYSPTFYKFLTDFQEGDNIEIHYWKLALTNSDIFKFEINGELYT